MADPKGERHRGRHIIDRMRTEHSNAEDYRESHQQRGGCYDATIFSSPLDAYMDRWEATYLAQILPRLFPASIPRYLDFACGTGRITQRIAPHAVETYGIDVSQSMLDAAHKKCNAARFMCADLTRSTLDLGLFDLASAFRFFGNAQDELRSAALAAISRHLRPGGYLIINNHRNPRSLLGLWHRAGADAAAPSLDLTHAKLKALLRRHGFEIAAQRAIGFWLYRFKLTTAACLESPAAARLERAFQHSMFARFAPDAVVVARKVA